MFPGTVWDQLEVRCDFFSHPVAQVRRDVYTLDFLLSKARIRGSKEKYGHLYSALPPKLGQCFPRLKVQ